MRNIRTSTKREDDFLHAANRKPFEFKNALRRTWGNRIDFDQATAELKLLPIVINHACMPDDE